MPRFHRLGMLVCASGAACVLAVLAGPIAVHAEDGGGTGACDSLASAPGSTTGPLTAVELGYTAATTTAQYRLVDGALPAGTGITYEIRACEWYENDGDRVADSGSRTTSGRFDETTTLVGIDTAGATVTAGTASFSIQDHARVPTATPPFLVCMRAELVGTSSSGGDEGGFGDEGGGSVVVDHLGNTLCFNPAIAVPPPVTLPEAPMAVLMPLGALAVFGGAVGLSRRRQRPGLPPDRA